MLFRLLLGIGFTMLLLLSNNSYSSISCPEKISETNPIATHTNYARSKNVKLEQPILVEYNDTVYRLKAGYLYPWASAQRRHWTGIFSSEIRGYDLESVNSKPKGFGFTFWMPSLRYVERNMLNLPSLRVCEDGRKFDPEAYVVKVSIEPMRVIRDGEILTPKLRHENTYSMAGSYSFLEGLDLLESENKKITTFYSKLNDDLQLHLRCSAADRVSNPLCSGVIYFPKDNIHAIIKFPSTELDNWKDIVDGIKFLLEQFNQEAKSVLGGKIGDN